MTKKEMDILKDFCDEIDYVKERMDGIFDEFQNMSRDLERPIYCSVYDNRENLIGTSYDHISRVLYDEYLELQGREQILSQLRYILLELKSSEEDSISITYG